MKKFLENKKEYLIKISIFIITLLLTFILYRYPAQSIAISSSFAGGLFLLLFLIIFAITGFKIAKVFLSVGAKISILFLVSQLYCAEIVIKTTESLNSINLLLSFSLIFLVYEFIVSYYSEIKPYLLKKECNCENNSKCECEEKDIKKKYTPWILIALIILSSIFFLYTLITAFEPIVNSLCVLKN
jgi:hypothetical protein